MGVKPSTEPVEAARPSTMKVRATREAVQFISERGGRLYVWADLTVPRMLPPVPHSLHRTTLRGARVQPPLRRRFRPFYNDGDVEAPGQLIVELSGWHKKRVSVRTPDFWIKE